MPRDLSGNMTLPAGNPVVTNTAISSAVHNATVADLAAEIQDSLSRSGKGGMTAPFKFADGSEATPAASFANETGTGWYRHAAGEIRLAILGAWKAYWDFAGLTVKGVLGLMDNGGANNRVTITPPSGLVTSYGLTLPAALPGSTLPVTLTAGGAMATAQLVNAQQNFGTPSAATDVVIKSYVDELISALTGINANLPATPSVVYKSPVTGVVHFRSATIWPVTGAITGVPATGVVAGASVLFTLSAGYRMANDATDKAYIPILWYDAGTTAMKTGALVSEGTTGNVYFYDSAAASNLASGDVIYTQGISWHGR